LNVTIDSSLHGLNHELCSLYATYVSIFMLRRLVTSYPVISNAVSFPDTEIFVGAALFSDGWRCDFVSYLEFLILPYY
jgi:hypothetical protein